MLSKTPSCFGTNLIHLSEASWQRDRCFRTHAVIGTRGGAEVVLIGAITIAAMFLYMRLAWIGVMRRVVKRWVGFCNQSVVGVVTHWLGRFIGDGYTHLSPAHSLECSTARLSVSQAFTDVRRAHHRTPFAQET
jgi:hypothetical protein